MYTRILKYTFYLNKKMKQKLEVVYVLDNLNMCTELKKTLLGVIRKPESSTAS